MPVVSYANELKKGQRFVVVLDDCPDCYGSRTQGPFTFLYWEQPDLIAVVKDGGVRRTLSMSPKEPGVDMSVDSNADFICTPGEFKYIGGNGKCRCEE